VSLCRSHHRSYDAGLLALAPYLTAELESELRHALTHADCAELEAALQRKAVLAREQGLETCAQEAWASRHQQVAEFLGVGSELMLFCGLALGYGDYSAPVNRLRTERTPVERFTTFHE